MDDNAQNQQPGSGDSSMGAPMPPTGSGQPMGGSSDDSGMGSSPPTEGSDQSGMPTPSSTPGDMSMPEVPAGGDAESGEGEKPESGNQPPHDPMDAIDPHPDASQQS